MPFFPFIRSYVYPIDAKPENSFLVYFYNPIFMNHYIDQKLKKIYAFVLMVEYKWKECWIYIILACGYGQLHCLSKKQQVALQLQTNKSCDHVCPSWLNKRVKRHVQSILSMACGPSYALHINLVLHGKKLQGFGIVNPNSAHIFTSHGRTCILT